MAAFTHISVTGRIMSIKNSNDTIGNRTRDLPVCIAVPQPTAPPRAPTEQLSGRAEFNMDLFSNFENEASQ
jgi:hypothetical protein